MNGVRSTEDRLPESDEIDRVPVRRAVEILHEAERAVDAAIGPALPAIAELAEAAAAALAAGGRLIYVGAGTSGRLGALDAAECPPTFGVEPDRVLAILAGGPEAMTRAVEGAEDDPVAGARAVREAGAGPTDVVVGISASGRAAFVRGALEAAGRRGARRALVTTNPPPEGAPAEIVVAALVGPEPIAGSTRLKSGTATKRILNMVSTAAMIRLGKVYRNLMVDVVPTNEKLRRRARRIVSEVLGVAEPEADRLLAAAGRPSPVKVAIVMGRLGVGAPEARRRLDEAGGFLHRILG